MTCSWVALTAAEQVMLLSQELSRVRVLLQLKVLGAVLLCRCVVQAARVPVNGLSQPTSWLDV
jgi:hypothetical protein